jgi:7,8-dihydropterin-6-yl-methyl-4-(beta-D-ribofuranosyl)aminobenzene 5'-phosphate synthase
MTVKIIASGSTKIERRMKKWGLAILIDEDVLFDTFCSGDYLAAGCKKNHVDLSKIRHIVLSHEHWDHTGGLWWFLEQHPHVNVYVCPGFSEEFKDKIREYTSTVVEVAKTMEIKEGVVTTGEIQGEYHHQPTYEQSLVLKQQGILAVITGCSHPGILTILSHINQEYKEQIDFLTGGLHLKDKPDDEIKKIATVLDSIYRINTLAPFHCTGGKAISYFKKSMPDQFVKVGEGDCFYFDKEVSSWRQSGNR